MASSGRLHISKAMGSLESPVEAHIRRPSSISGFADRTSQLNEHSDKITPAQVISNSRTKQKSKMKPNNAKPVASVGPFAAHKSLLKDAKLGSSTSPRNFEDFYDQFKSKSGGMNKSGSGTVADS